MQNVAAHFNEKRVMGEPADQVIGNQIDEDALPNKSG